MPKMTEQETALAGTQREWDMVQTEWHTLTQNQTHQDALDTLETQVKDFQAQLDLAQADLRTQRKRKNVTSVNLFPLRLDWVPF